MTYEEMIDSAIKRLDKMNAHHPAFVMYSEAKFLYKLLPSMIALLEFAKMYRLDDISHPDDLEIHAELIDFITAIVEGELVE